MVDALVFALVILAVAFLPSLYYLVRARNWERYGREPYRRLMMCFGYGAVVAIIISIFFEWFILGNLDNFERIYELGDESFLGAVLVAPVVEESVKAFGLVFVTVYLLREEDGMVYGIAIGLGFAATENMFYELSALSAGVEVYLITAVLRTVSSTILHATATGVSGLGVGKAVVRKQPLFYALPYLLVAIVMHAAFNFIASLNTIYPDLFGELTCCVSFLILITFAAAAWWMVRDRISAA
jgi:RsiW-degrading membrane proteinase PrsW (M82 family)